MARLRTAIQGPWAPILAWVAAAGTLLAAQLARQPITDWRYLATSRMPWDGGTYVTIATDGYTEGNAGWFPGLPMLVRAAEVVTGDWHLAWLLVAVASGMSTAALFWQWCEDVGLDRRAQRLALALLLLYPFGFHLLGFPYTEAPFLACAIGAFLLLDRGRSLGAGLLALVAGGLRPTGVVLVAALLVRAWEQGDGLGTDPAERRWRMATPLLGLVVPAAFAAYCARRFGDALLYLRIQQEITDGPTVGVPASWPPYMFVTRLPTLDRWTGQLGAIVQGTLTVAATLALPRVVRRFGWGPATYVAGVCLLIWTGSWEFSAAGRYLLAAFPLAALGGEALASRPRIAALLLPAMGITSLIMALGFTSGSIRFSW